MEAMTVALERVDGVELMLLDFEVDAGGERDDDGVSDRERESSADRDTDSFVVALKAVVPETLAVTDADREVDPDDAGDAETRELDVTEMALVVEANTLAAAAGLELTPLDTENDAIMDTVDELETETLFDSNAERDNDCFGLEEINELALTDGVTLFGREPEAVVEDEPDDNDESEMDVEIFALGDAEDEKDGDDETFELAVDDVVTDAAFDGLKIAESETVWTTETDVELIGDRDSELDVDGLCDSSALLDKDA